MEEYNPWWRGVGGLREDYDLQKWEESPVRWVPRLLWDVLGELRPFSLHFLFGPRQVGKTTLLKLLVKTLIGEGWDPLTDAAVLMDSMHFRHLPVVRAGEIIGVVTVDSVFEEALRAGASPRLCLRGGRGSPCRSGSSPTPEWLTPRASWRLVE